MSLRRLSREIALQFLFQLDQSKEADCPTGLSEIAKLLNTHFVHFNVPEAAREYASELSSGSLLNRQEIDLKIQEAGANWKISRMSTIDRSLLRMCVYELFYIKDVPATVVIDEGIELAKKFGTEASPAFVNGLLDSLNKKNPKLAIS